MGIGAAMRLGGVGTTALLAACAFGVVETPLRGPAPRSVLVLLPRDRTGLPDRDVRSLAFGADRALQERGYRALPLDVGFALASRCGDVADAAPGLDELQQLQRAADVDAVLQIVVDGWDLDDDRRLGAATWDIEWELVAVKDGQQLWRHRERGSWHRAPPEREDPTRAPDAEPPTLPFGSLRPRDFRDADDLAATLHRAAMARLPRRQP